MSQRQTARRRNEWRGMETAEDDDAHRRVCEGASSDVHKLTHPRALRMRVKLRETHTSSNHFRITAVEKRHKLLMKRVFYFNHKMAPFS